jgi:hypothetical protein
MLTRIRIHFRPNVARSTLTLATFLMLCLSPAAQAATVHEEDGKTFIVDQKGERWEITQAIGQGFSPEGFQFGIGRDAIRPLDDQHLGTEETKLPGRSRVIGISGEASAHAYSIRRLTRHEIANTRLGDIPIAAAY